MSLLNDALRKRRGEPSRSFYKSKKSGLILRAGNRIRSRFYLLIALVVALAVVIVTAWISVKVDHVSTEATAGYNQGLKTGALNHAEPNLPKDQRSEPEKTSHPAQTNDQESPGLAKGMQPMAPVKEFHAELAATLQNRPLLSTTRAKPEEDSDIRNGLSPTPLIDKETGDGGEESVSSPADSLSKSTVQVQDKETHVSRKAPVVFKKTSKVRQPNALFGKKQSLPSPQVEKQPGSQFLSPAERLYDKAQLYYRQGRLEEAMAMYRQILKIEPVHETAFFNLVSGYVQTRQFGKAFELIKGRHGKSEMDSPMLLNLAASQIGLGRFADALETLEEAELKQDAPNFSIYFHRGVALSHLDRPKDALTWYQKAEAFEPHDEGLLFNMALAYDRLKEYAKAVAYYTNYLTQAKTPEVAEEHRIRQRIRVLKTYLVRRIVSPVP